MHYANGRKAVAGDPIVYLAKGQQVAVGIAYSLRQETTHPADSGTARIARTNYNDKLINLSDCLHADDAIASAQKATNTSESYS